MLRCNQLWVEWLHIVCAQGTLVDQLNERREEKHKRRHQADLEPSFTSHVPSGIYGLTPLCLYVEPKALRAGTDGCPSSSAIS